MARFPSYTEVSSGLLVPATDIVRVAEQVSLLPAVQNGFAVLIGSAAWGSVSVRSDIDLIAFKCPQTSNLEADVQAIRAQYSSSVNSNIEPPLIDVIWIGAESGQVVERDNIVSRSTPISEHRVVTEIFERTCSRLLDHLLALADVKGGVWRNFAQKYMTDANTDSSIRRDVLREYTDGVAVKWRQVNWLSTLPANIGSKHLGILGSLENFAYHACRLILSDHGIYPKPDRRPEIRAAVKNLPDDLSSSLSDVFGPAFLIGEECEMLIKQFEGNESGKCSEEDYYSAIISQARSTKIDEIELFVWKYVGIGQGR
ncbi:hypothetical protein [Hoeflea sp.]|uniref:hypothetical protein n=1 Tax=Hoeflea sp. TaxID=1940281 RepID=UPI003B0239E1